MAAACGDDDPGTTAQPDSAASLPAVGSTTVLPADSTATDPAGTAPGASSDTIAPPSTNGASPPGPLPPAPPSIDGHVPVGAFAPAILRPDLSQRVVVEVRSQAGAEPASAALAHVESVLGSVTGKPVSIQGGPTIGGGGRAWTSGEITATADADGPLPQGGGTAVIRLLFVHGSFGGDTGVLGAAVRGDVAAIFQDQVRASGSLLVGSESIEVAVITHEVGHILGLVDLYLDTGRHDPDHPGHSTNPDSVMYWAVESSLVAQVLGGGPPNDFDDADRADLAAIRAGA